MTLDKLRRYNLREAIKCAMGYQGPRSGFSSGGGGGGEANAKA